MNTTILLEARTVYGVENYYVVSEHADAVRRLTGKMTVNAKDVSALTSLGFDVRMKARAEIPAIEAVLR